jgi:glycosyltransferase involved in cell wall biosynthesis
MLKSRLLFLAPLPPPVTGMSVASLAALEGMSPSWDIKVVNLSKQSLRSGNATIVRAREIIGIACDVASSARKADRGYITLSQSTAGNLKDLMLLGLFGQLRRRTIAHLHGGPGMRAVLGGRFAKLNRKILGSLAGIVILGERHRDIFAALDVPIHVVPNYADPDLFLPVADVMAKHLTNGPLRVLALANFVHGKGQRELLDAWRLLEPRLRSRTMIDFAGAFESRGDERRFLADIEGLNGVTFHGIVGGEAKKKLLWDSHILSIPSYHRYGEGQPLSILEAYAAGLAVVATDHGGIFDVFTPALNGYAVEKASAESIAAALTRAHEDRDALTRMACHNRAEAEQHYTLEKYTRRLETLIRDAF